MVHCCNSPQDKTKSVCSTALRLLLERHSIINMGLSTAAKIVCLVFITTLLLAMLHHHSLADMKMEWGEKTKFRKVLYALKDKEKKAIFNGNENRNENGNMKKKKRAVEWELRAAPLGPDPLHHNGGSPRNSKKPTAMP